MRRWAITDDDIMVSLSVVSRELAVEDDVADDAGCFVTGGGAGAMGQSRLELWDDGGDVVVAQLTTMIAAGADDNGTNMPLTLVRTTGKETGFEAACSLATVLLAIVDGCWNDGLSDEEDEHLSDKCPLLAATAAADLPLVASACTHMGDLTANCCDRQACPAA